MTTITDNYPYPILENSVPKTGNQFFSKKNLIFLLIFLIVVILIGVFTSVFFLGIDFNTLDTLAQRTLAPDKVPFLIGLIIMFLYYWFWNSFTVWLNARHFNIKANFWDWMVFGITNVFIAGISPLQLGSDPYRFYWLTRHGLKVKEALVVATATALYTPMMSVIVTWPSFIIVSTKYGEITSSAQGLTAYWFGFVGLMLYMVVFLVLFLLSYSCWFHVLVGRIWNWVLKILKKPYKTKSQIIEEYHVNASFQRSYLKLLKNWKNFLIQISGVTIWFLFRAFSVYFVLQLLNTTVISNYNPSAIYNITIVAIAANNFVPIPGGEGTMQIVLQRFITAFDSNFSAAGSVSDSAILNQLNVAIFVWRSFLYYLPTVVGAFFFPIILYKHYRYKDHWREKISNKKSTKNNC
ncbi:lysylphosphatidylglycerol synthase transmembrane domain-containing protein [[Mycoplasma] testudinis]|uniref:lysylphosphatidylglycerol synthase transmembrane domain-containing protein n=1 Tax=[Mycoplasma] testudinis TaxID=33924 RepID=UPI0004826231|nr:YbhN family protein [[Mycoplasma] testudinis]